MQNPYAQQNQRNVHHNLHGDAKQLALAQEAEIHELTGCIFAGEAADALVGGGGGHSGNQQRQAGIQEAAAQRDHHGLHAAIGDEEAGQGTADGGCRHGNQGSHPDIHPCVAPQHADDDAGQADDGGGLNINAAGNHHHGDKQRNDANADVVDDAVHDGLGAQEFGVGRAEHHEFQYQEHHQEQFPALKNLFQQIFHDCTPPSCSAVLDRRRFLRVVSMERRCARASMTTMTISIVPVMVLL